MTAPRLRLKNTQPKALEIENATRAAVALILSPLPRGGHEALLIRRAVDPRDPWSGQIGLPGGRRESGDEDLLATALRETREEVGITLDRSETIGRLDDIQPKGPGLPAVVVRPFVFEIGKRRPLRTSPEVDHGFWLSLDNIRSAAGRAVVLVRGKGLEVPAYKPGPYVVWGATRNILTGLFDSVSRGL